MGFVNRVITHAVQIEFNLAETLSSLNSSGSRRDNEFLKKESEHSKGWLFDVLKKVVFVSAGYVDRNPRAQEDMFNVIELLLDKVDVVHKDRELFVWDLLIFIFLKNRSLCELVKRPVVQKMGVLVSKANHTNHRFLDFFLTIVKPLKTENCILTNQNHTIQALTSPNSLLLTYPEDPLANREDSLKGSKRGFFFGKGSTEDEAKRR